jgi:hypothetical protein
MATITATFQNNYSESRKWTIWDVGIDPASPKLLFDDYLDKDQDIAPLTLHQDDGGIQGHARYKRSDGALTDVDVSSGDIVQMD